MNAIALCAVLLFAQASRPGPPPSNSAAPQSAEQSTPAPDQATSTKPPLPNPDASGNYHVGDGVTAPKPLYEVPPEIPLDARKTRFSATVTVALMVDAKGFPTDVHVAQSASKTVRGNDPPVTRWLDENAVKAVKQYRFQPAKFQGKPVPVRLNVEVNFQIF